MEKNWKRMKLKDFEKEIESLGLKELEKLWKEVRERGKTLQREAFTDALDKLYLIEKEMMKRKSKGKGKKSLGNGIEKGRS
jgi:hypothetical protein